MSELPITATDAPGSPGMLPNWCNGAKQMVGTSIGPARVWFTIGRGIVNEVYYPRVDIPQIRDLGFIISDGQGFWQEIKQLPECRVTCAQAGVPTVVIVHEHQRFRFTQRIVADPQRDVLLLELALQGDETLRPYVLLAPHLGATGRDNKAIVSQLGYRQILAATQGPFSLALAAVDSQQNDALQNASVGYSGFSDAWQDFHNHGHLQARYLQAGPGNVALSAELPRECVLGLGFSSSVESAATLAISALLQPFVITWQQTIQDWQQWQQPLLTPELDQALPADLLEMVNTSALVLHTHHDQTFRGALIASLSIPWGESQEERPGYHLVWPRDLVECAGALLALNCHTEARDILRYLITTQRADGSWYQNQWLGGTPYWTGLQLDQVAFPVLLAGLLADRQALDGVEVATMVRKALGFIALHGPISLQDRWEEDSGINTFTLAVCIAGLVSGAEFLDTDERQLILQLADFWNHQLETWTAVKNTAFAQAHGVEGYYPRIVPPEVLTDDTALSRVMPIKNLQQDPNLAPTEQIGGDFLQLVRYGLRAADDPLILDSVKLLNTLLKVELPQGPCWYRYTSDGYGEHSDGSAYDGTGQGRLWPLLTGEYGHYIVSKGEDALPYLQAMRDLADEAGMIPEQVWDANDIPERFLWKGRATHSAMPLAWAHAEYIKLACSIARGYPVDRPERVWQRYQGKRPSIQTYFWSQRAPLKTIPAGNELAFCLAQPTTIYWQTDQDLSGTLHTTSLPLGLEVAHLALPTTASTTLTFRFEGGSFESMQTYQILITLGV